MTKEFRPERLLAIDPGTREMGYADFYDDQLLDYGVKMFDPVTDIKYLLQEIENVIERMIIEKTPDKIILEKNRFSQITNNVRLTLAITKLKAVAKQHHLPVIEYAPNTVRAVITQDGSSTKMELARTLTTFYPELKTYIRRQTPSALQTFMNITDAIACGKTYLILSSKMNEKKEDDTSLA